MADEKPGPVDLVHRAMQELGDATDVELAAFIRERYGVRIDPRFVPIVKASLRERVVIEQARQRARELAERLQAEQAARPRGKSRRKGAKDGPAPGEALSEDTPSVSGPAAD